MPEMKIFELQTAEPDAAAPLELPILDPFSLPSCLYIPKMIEHGNNKF